MSQKPFPAPAISRRSVLISGASMTLAMSAPRVTGAQSKRIVSTIFGVSSKKFIAEL
jgi:hypothetical protein